MFAWSRVPAALGPLLVALLLPARPRAATDLELYGTFQSMGVIVTLTAGEDADQDATASVSYRIAGSGGFRPGLPLSRVAGDRFVGSLFFLAPGTTYDVRVTFSDPDGAPLDAAVVAGTAATRAELALPAPTRSYQVAPAGSGTACTAAAACALATALAQVQPGEEVVLGGGVYHQGDLSIPRSGRAGAPIVIRGAAGQEAVLDGADPATFPWTAQGGGVYRTTVNAPDPNLVAVDGARLFPYQTLADLQALAWGVPGFFASGTDVSVRLAGDADPAGRQVRVSRFHTAFTVQQRFVAFVDLTFRHYGLGDYAEALYLDGASDILVDRCTFVLDDLGIGLKRASDRNVIQDSTFSDTDFLWPWDGVKTGTRRGLETGGIRLYDPMTGRGTVIRRNTFHDYFDGLGVCPSDTAAVTNETDVYENLVYDAGDDGMETDGRCSNVRIWGNTFHDVLDGVSLAPVTTGPVYALRNLVYRTGAGNSPYTGLPFKFNSGGDASGAIFLFHNTADGVTAGSVGFDVRAPGAWASIVSRNNVWAGAAYALQDANPTQPLDLDHDDLYTTQPGELAWWDGLADRHLNTLEELRAATGQELHGLAVAPGFAAAALGDYALADGSPLVDAGVVIPGVNDGYTGAAPDLGAFESSPGARVDGACGAADGRTTPTAPTADLCAAGTPAVSGADPWTWDCLGANGGADATCSAQRSGGGPGGGGSGGCASGGAALSLTALGWMALGWRRPRRVAARPARRRVDPGDP